MSIFPTNGRLGNPPNVFTTPEDYIEGRTRHEAIDIITAGPQDIHATFDGKITTSIDRYNENTETGYGNRIYLMSTDGSVVDSFAHCEQGSLLPVGTVVSKGDRIARTGRTGYRVPLPTYHTHWEREVLGKRVDPLDLTTLPKQANELSMLDKERLDRLEKIFSEYVVDVNNPTDKPGHHEKNLSLLNSQDLDSRLRKVENLEGKSPIVRRVLKLTALKFGKARLKEWFNKLNSK